MCLLQLFAVQSVVIRILKLTLAIASSRFSTKPKGQEKNLNISRAKRAFNIK